MAAYIYANGQYHLLAGNKIVKDGAMLPMKATDKIIVNGTAYNLGLATGGENSAIGNRFDNGTEPASGAKWYITPDGAGNMDGTSWNNAAAGSQIHAILLSCASGDSIYIAEGEYTTERIMDIPAGVTIYGGFPAVNPTWATRNGFIYQSVFNGNSSFNFTAGSDGIVDGLVIKNYRNTGSSKSKNCIANIYFYSAATNCIAVNCTANISFHSAATNCIAVNCTAGNSIFYSAATNCIAVNCTAGNYIFSSTATNCTAVNCTANISFHSTVTNCKAVNCNASYYIFGSSNLLIHATNCIAVNCTASNSIFYKNDAVGGTMVNCTAVNCTASAAIFNSDNYSFNAKNCLSWNNNGKEYSIQFTSSSATTCTGSVYDSMFALTLGTDNSIARFTNTGFAPAQGVQDVGDCPSPIDDPDGYAEWLAAFGDWHPASNSFLLGAGTYDSSVTTDLDGTTRPNPPAIGAYEAVSA